MKKTKIFVVALVLCCVLLVGVTCVWAAKLFNLEVGGRISFEAQGVDCYVSQGKFLTSKQTDETLQVEYQNIHKTANPQDMFKPLDISVESLKYKDYFPTWTNLDLKFNEFGESAYLYFTITNRAELNTENLAENEFVKVEIEKQLSADETKTLNADILVPTVDYIAPGETNHYFIEFKVLDTWGNALLDDFSVRIMLDRHIDEVVLDTPENEIQKTWQTATVPSDFNARLRSLAYGDGKYVAVGIGGNVLHSDDGETWTAINKFTTNILISCAFGDGVFVCTDSNGNIYKRDESTLLWQCVHTVPDFVNGYVQAVKYINNMFVAICDDKVLTSPNGEDWTQVKALGKDLTSLAYGNGTYIFAGLGGYIVSTSDFEYWTELSQSDFGDIQNISFAKGRFFICGPNGKVSYSTDTGETWKTSTSNTTSTMSWIRDMCEYSGDIYAVGYATTGSGEIWVSSDKGATWKVSYTSANRLWKINVAERILYVVGDNGTIIAFK